MIVAGESLLSLARHSDLQEVGQAKLSNWKACLSAVVLLLLLLLPPLPLLHPEWSRGHAADEHEDEDEARLCAPR